MSLRYDFGNCCLEYIETNDNITFGLGSCILYFSFYFFYFLTLTKLLQWNLLRTTSENHPYKLAGSCETLDFDSDFFDEPQHVF